MLLRKINDSWRPRDFYLQFGRDMAIGDVTWIDGWEKLVKDGMAEALDDHGVPVQFVEEKKEELLPITESILTDLKKIADSDSRIARFWNAKKATVGQRINIQVVELMNKIRQELYAETYREAYGNKTVPDVKIVLKGI